MATHTPAPWDWYGPTKGEGLTFSHEAHVGPGEGSDSAGPIAAVGGDDDEQAVANARLIAAAPAMLAALKASLKGGSAAVWEASREQVRAAIALAESQP